MHDSVDDATELLTARNANERPTQHATFNPTSNLTASQSIRSNLTLLTLRNHIQVVLAGLNEETGSGIQIDIKPGEGSAPSLAWKAIEHVPLELRQAKLMEIYFQIVRPQVVAEAEKLAGELGVASPVESSGHNTSTLVKDQNEDNLESIPLWKVEHVSCEDIWYTLVFRSIYWLMLHDFHRDDVQIPKSDLFGSRLPVYIA
ncbi:modin [Colletotrichum camelliae]|nr:modin [Colletotrichum camelliae]